jgi:phage N-6-adenine-methyltransferase
MVADVIYSSQNSDWGTPQRLYDQLDKFFHFDMDVCADAWNAKHRCYISPEMDAFSTPWIGDGDSTTAWMNPPYGAGEKRCLFPHDRCKKKKCVNRGYHIDEDIPGVWDWVNRAINQVMENNITVVALLPSRTGERFFQQALRFARCVCFIKGRLKFDRPNGGDSTTAPFPSAIMVFSRFLTGESVLPCLQPLGCSFDLDLLGGSFCE